MQKMNILIDFYEHMSVFVHFLQKRIKYDRLVTMYSLSRKTSMGAGRIFHKEWPSEGWGSGLKNREQSTGLQAKGEQPALYTPRYFSPKRIQEWNPADILDQLDWPWDIHQPTYWLELANQKSEIGLKINDAKAAILGISQEKKWFLGKIADKIFRNAEKNWNIKLTDENKAQFLLGLQAAMEVKDISEKQRYTIVWRFAQGFLGQSSNAAVEQWSVDELPSNTSDSSNGTTDQIVPDSTSMMPPTANARPETIDPETLGRDLLIANSNNTEDDKNQIWESSIENIAAQVQNYDAQTANLNVDLYTYRSEEADRIDEQYGNKSPLQHIANEVSNIDIKDFGIPEIMSDIAPGSSVRVNWSDDGWVSQVQCTRLSDGDFRLQFPDCEFIIDDDPNNPEVAKKEMKLIKEVAETPLVRRLLNMGTGNFNLFRDRVQAKYDPTGKTKGNPEQLIKIMLEAILGVTLGNKDQLGEWANRIPRGIFASPNISLDMIQTSMQNASNSQKLMMSYALAEQWVFDIDSRQFVPRDLISKV